MSPSQASADSLSRLIEKVGKDSVSHLIDKRIILAIEEVKRWSIEMSNVKMAMIYYLVAERFKLDTMQIEFNKSPLNGEYYKLYDKFYGSHKRVADTINTLSKSGMDMNGMFLKLYDDPIARRSAIYFCKELKITQKSLESFFEKTIHESGKDIFENYYLFIELRRSACPNQEISAALLKRYEQWMESYLTDLYQKSQTEMPTELSNLSYTYRRIAYRLYSRNHTIDNMGKDFTFLVSSQQPSGGWSGFSFGPQESDPVSTIFGLWALLELREQVRVYK